MNMDRTLKTLRKSFRGLRLATVVGALLPLAPQSEAVHTMPLLTSPELKSHTQYRAEASLYERSIRSIATIATLKLDTPDAIKQAMDILERETPNLKHLPSFLVFSGINDSTFSGAVKRTTDTRSKAEILLKRLIEDPNRILEIDGARSLTRRLKDRTTADANTLRSVAERINTAIAGVDLTNHRMRIVPVFKLSAGELRSLSTASLLTSILTSFHTIFRDLAVSSAIEQELNRAAQQQFEDLIDRLNGCPDKVRKELESCLSRATSRVQQTRCRTRALEAQAECSLFNF